MLKSLQIKKENLQLVAVDVGPGIFTGLRVGVTTARTIGQVLNIPLVGVNRLEAMAAIELKRDPAACVVPTVPALPGEIYFGVYRGNDVLHPPAWVRMEEFKEQLKRFQQWHPQVIEGTQPPHPRVIGELAIRKYLTHLFGQSKGGRPGSSKNPFHYKNTMPLYLQPSWAERTALAKR